MRDKGLDKGLIRYFDDAPRNYRGQDKNFFGFRKMFRDYLTKLNVAFYDTCCPAATPTGIRPLRYDDTANVIQYFDSTSEAWLPVDAGALVSDSIALDDGLVSALAVRIGADANNGLYGVSDTQLGIAVEGVLVGGANTTGLFTGNISEQVAAAGVTVDGVLLKDGGVSNAGATMLATFYPLAAQQAITGAGAVNVTSLFTAFTSSGASQALTLANGTQIGQVKIIAHVVDGGSGILTPTSLSGGTTITFTTVAETAELIWNGTAWVVVKLYNTATPGTPPVLA
jgi:hypothetical protein